MAAAALAAFVAGVFVLQQQPTLPARTLLAAAAGAALILAAMALRSRRRRDGAREARVAAAVLLAAAFTLGFSYAGWRAHERLAVALSSQDEGRDVALVGIVAGLPAAMERGVRFEFLVEAVETPAVSVPPRIALAWYSPSAEVAPGQRWAFTARLRRPHGTFNPGGFDLEAWLFERNLRAGGYVRETPAPERLATMVWSIAAAIDRARAELRSRLLARLGGQRFGGVLIALVLGDQRAIAEEDWLLFNRSGISHLVSISGLHITMISGLVAIMAGALWRRSPRTLALAPAQAAAAAAAVVAALVYCLLAGWGVPAQRTFFMLLTVAAAMWLRIGARLPTTLALAAVVVCLLDPWAVIAPGFWLSFGAVAAIFLTVSGRPGAVEPGWKSRLREAGRVQLAVTLALLPLTAALFQQISVVSIVANTVAIPMVSLVVTPLALLAGLAVVLPEPLASLAVPCLALAHWLLAVLHQFLTVLTLPAWTSLPLPAPPWWTVALALAGVLWLLAPPGWPLRWAGALWLAPMLVWPATRPLDGELWVTALDVGQGSAILVESKQHAMLYDSGPRFSSTADAGGRIVLPYLRWRGIGAIDLLVVSHLDSDHSGGAASILRAIPVALALSSIDGAHPAVRGAAAVRRCESGQRIDLGAMRIDVLRPPASDYDRPRLPSNAASCVLRVSFGRHRLLLTGDLPAREEAELAMREPDLAVAWLSVPHHGSRGSSSDVLIDAAQPRWASVQAGYRNRFGHPDPEVTARYLARGVRVVRSDESGAAQWRFGRDGAVELHRWRATAHRYWHDRPGDGASGRGEPGDADDLPDPGATLSEPTTPY
jgi:competence protein ComEC